MLGTWNLALGWQNATITNNAVQYSVVIGSGAYSNQSGAVVIGWSGSRVGIRTPDPLYDFHVSGTGGFDNIVISGSISYSSDERLKENIKPINNALDKILLIQGVSYNWKWNGQMSYWVIAQDVEKVFPEMVGKRADGYKTVEYNELVWPLIESIRELKSQNDELKKRIEALESQSQR